MASAHEHEVHLDDLVDDARTGSGRAFTVLWERLSPVVAGYVRGRGVHEPDDVTSDVFLAAFANISSFGGDGAAFRCWLFTIAHHRAIDAIRLQKRCAADVPYEDGSDTRSVGSAESLALGHIECEEALRLVRRLGADQRDVLLLRLVADLSVEEVAKVLGRSAEAVRQLHRRALVRLRDLATNRPPATLVQPVASQRRPRYVPSRGEG